MKIEITGRHVDITDPIRNYINVRLKRLPKMLGNEAGVHFILSIEKHRHQAEVILTSKVGKITSVEQTADMYSSISKALEKLERQALKLKQKRIETKRIKSPAKMVAADSLRSSAPFDMDHRQRRVIMKEISKKPMALEEAMLYLNQSEDNFIVFRDAQTLLVTVLYKRKDGHYGLISPEE